MVKKRKGKKVRSFIRPDTLSKIKMHMAINEFSPMQTPQRNLPPPFTPKEMNSQSFLWKTEFQRRQREAFRREQLQNARKEGFWSFVMQGIID